MKRTSIGCAALSLGVFAPPDSRATRWSLMWCSKAPSANW
jgi:hypothetical protein